MTNIIKSMNKLIINDNKVIFFVIYLLFIYTVLPLNFLYDFFE